ncbi:hypothetical protein B5S31_g3095 [[Candida] boidinii]|uniref:Unnamed protein product n=1 Tax=Candida boidinii TaxID=5477 RepID=A0ACB5TVF9_CANBO|nr:hypothetical protein B5S29_g5733 [[Candida] boidinii]OWB73357.1 hypothetical protein B5S31_g3095 [[Candida] boidinii]OWB78806.1 hypothetical protein B5S32_g3010 [[Candida] boidinii]GME95605.1 unnamed protein product [[Candida] boidinii]
MSLPSILILGSTGLCGSNFLRLISEKSSEFEKIITLSRRKPEINNEINKQVSNILESNTDNWPDEFAKLDLPENGDGIFFSGFGTTRKAAGSAENFKKIDYGINYDCAKAAKESNKFKTLVLVSTVSANKDSSFLYLQSKGKLEQDIIDLKFDRTIILRPGPLLGHREKSKGFGDGFINKFGGFFKDSMFAGLLYHPITSEDVAKCAYYLAKQPITKENKLVIIESADMIKTAKLV